MRQRIHHHFDQLSRDETIFIDAVFGEIFQHAQDAGIPLAGDSRIERAVDALARAVIESRPKSKPRVRVKAGRDPEVVAREELERERRERIADEEDAIRWGSF